MNHREVLQYRQNRISRNGKPFSVFYDTFQQSIDAADSLLTEDPTLKFTPLLERSVVISTVTAIEVYFRDMLHIIFTQCAPVFFEPAIRKIHSEKYDITDLIAVYRNSLHPLELVVSGQSFQNIGIIDKVFSNFVEGNFWGKVLEIQTRIKDQPERVYSLDHHDLAGLEALFSLRHELVHNPGRRSVITTEVIDNLDHAAGMIFGADILLTSTISKNLDPELMS